MVEWLWTNKLMSTSEMWAQRGQLNKSAWHSRAVSFWYEANGEMLRVNGENATSK